MVGLLSRDEIETLLRRHRVGRLGCCLDDGPYVVPMNYAYDGIAIYAASGPGQKIDAMQAQPRVSFEIDEIDGAEIWRSVIAEGVYEELTNDGERSAAFDRLRMTWTGQASCNPAPPAGIIVFRIRLLEKTGRFGREQ